MLKRTRESGIFAPYSSDIILALVEPAEHQCVSFSGGFDVHLVQVIGFSFTKSTAARLVARDPGQLKAVCSVCNSPYSAQELN